MTAIAAEQLPDPLLTPLLALLKDAINADLATQFGDAGITPDDVVRKTANHPITAQLLAGAASLPMLIAFRRVQQSQRRTFGHVDELVTVRLQYVSSACASDRLNARWPILDRVWRAAFDALCAGHHTAHAEDAHVLESAGVVEVKEPGAGRESPQKLESYLPMGEATFPMWEADVQVVWRDLSKEAGRTANLYPVLSLNGRITQQLENDGREPAGDVVIHSYTPTGIEELDAEPYEEEAVLP